MESVGQDRTRFGMKTNFDRKVAKSIDSRTWVDRRFLEHRPEPPTDFVESLQRHRACMEVSNT